MVSGLLIRELIMTQSLSLHRLSRRLRYLFLVILIAAPLEPILFWTFINKLPAVMLTGFPVEINQPLAWLAQILGFCVSLIPLAIVMVGLYAMTNLFALYERGTVFGKTNVACIRTLGKVLIYWFFAMMIYTPLISMALTLDNPLGQRLLIVQFEFLNLTSLLLGVVLLAIAKVMQLGYELNEDHAKVI